MLVGRHGGEPASSAPAPKPGTRASPGSGNRVPPSAPTATCQARRSCGQTQPRPPVARRGRYDRRARSRRRRRSRSSAIMRLWATKAASARREPPRARRPSRRCRRTQARRAGSPSTCRSGTSASGMLTDEDDPPGLELDDRRDAEADGIDSALAGGLDHVDELVDQRAGVRAVGRAQQRVAERDPAQRRDRDLGAAEIYTDYIRRPRRTTGCACARRRCSPTLTGSQARRRRRIE